MGQQVSSASFLGPRLKKNTTPFRYARVLPRLEKHRYEIRILVFIRVLLDELGCSIRRTREFHRDDAKETLFLWIRNAKISMISPLSLIIDDISECVCVCVILCNICEYYNHGNVTFVTFLWFFFFFLFFLPFLSATLRFYIYMKI